MGTYRVYFRDPSGIVGRHDFMASDGHAAVALADLLCDACSDRCTSFEVWAGDNRIVAPRTPRTTPRANEIAERHQEIVIECEDSIQRSNWAIASSERLLARLADWRARLDRGAG